VLSEFIYASVARIIWGARVGRARVGIREGIWEPTFDLDLVAELEATTATGKVLHLVIG
jgi:hypothetical protein